MFVEIQKSSSWKTSEEDEDEERRKRMKMRNVDGSG